MVELNIIGDIAGQFEALSRLVAKMPAAGRVVAVGDLVDRGPQSRQVLDYFREDSAGRIALFGNHELMTINGIKSLLANDDKKEDPSSFQALMMWMVQGGIQTLLNFTGISDDGIIPDRGLLVKAASTFVEGGYLDFLNKMPLILVTDDGCVVSHAPIGIQVESRKFDHRKDGINLLPHGKLSADDIFRLVWSREPPLVQAGMLQVFGHNSMWGLRQFTEPTDERIFATCIDSSGQGVLTGLHWPSLNLYREPY